ncbi:MAG: putative transcriptional regulator, TetR family [Actinomycetia bacterium]|nr:putative transcriptional regulator, TetR family [Actinomycetes bacterium]
MLTERAPMAARASNRQISEGETPRRRRTRSDFLASRRALLEGVEILLATQERPFSLAELAQQANTSVATAYRHFTDAQEARDAYYAGLIEELTAEIAAAEGDDPAERMREACRIWVRQAARWARAAVRIRSPEGFLSRHRRGDERIVAIYDTLAPFITALIDSGRLPRQPIDYAVLMWITVFDERVILDLLATAGWTVDMASRELTGTVLSMLGHPVGHPAVTPPYGPAVTPPNGL